MMRNHLIRLKASAFDSSKLIKKLSGDKSCFTFPNYEAQIKSKSIPKGFPSTKETERNFKQQPNPPSFFLKSSLVEHQY